MIDWFDIYNEDCLESMENIIPEQSVDLVLTSPPYNMTGRKGGISDSGRYDVYEDWKTPEEYLDWTVSVFSGFDRILNRDGVVLYNFSYSIENPSLPYSLVSRIESKTPFRIVDTIIWKKGSGLPFPANPRRLSRIWEYVFVFVRDTDIQTFRTARKPVSENQRGQKYYETVYNFVTARNNDGATHTLNQATYSTELCLKLFDIYLKDGCTVYDPFCGTGTTGAGCAVTGKKNIKFIGSEISEQQCEYARERIIDLGQEIQKNNFW